MLTLNQVIPSKIIWEEKPEISHMVWDTKEAEEPLVKRPRVPQITQYHEVRGWCNCGVNNGIIVHTCKEPRYNRQVDISLVSTPRVVVDVPARRFPREVGIKAFLSGKLLSPEGLLDLDSISNAMDYSRLMWVIGIENYNEFFYSLLKLTPDQQQTFASDLADRALEHVLAVKLDKRFAGMTHEQLYGVYSARRSLRAPMPLKHPMSLLGGLFRKAPRMASILISTYERYIEDAMDDLISTTRFFLKPHNTFKACLESKASDGGFNFVSSQLYQEIRVGYGWIPDDRSRWKESDAFAYSESKRLELDKLEEYWFQIRRFVNHPGNPFHAEHEAVMHDLENKIMFLRGEWETENLPSTFSFPDSKEIPPGTKKLLNVAKTRLEYFLELLTLALDYVLEPGFYPELYALDLPERGGKHRIPLIPEWAPGIVAGVLGNLLKPTLDRINRSTFRGDPIKSRGRKNIYYSCDFKGGTDNLDWAPARSLWHIFLDRMIMPEWAKHLLPRLHKAVEVLIGPHLIFETKNRLEAIREFVDGTRDSKFHWPEDKLHWAKDYWMKKSVFCGKDQQYVHQIKRGPLRGSAILGDFTQKVQFTRERLFLKRRMFSQDVARMDGARVTTRGLHMCYGLSFPTLSWLVFICHYRLNKQLGPLAPYERNIQYDNVGDDNVSAHDQMSTITELKKYHNEIGAITHQKKSKISQKGFILAETWYLWVGTTLKVVNQPKLKVLCPEVSANTWLTQPAAVYQILEGVGLETRTRALEHVWRTWLPKYKRLINMNIDIFNNAPNPLFPIKFHPTWSNNMVEPIRRGDLKEINALFSEPVYTKTDKILLPYEGFAGYAEKPTNFQPLLEETNLFARVKVFNQKAFEKISLQWRALPGWMGGQVPERPYALTFAAIEKRFKLLRPGGGTVHIWPSEPKLVIPWPISTSIYDLSRGYCFLPFNRRRFLKDDPFPKDLKTVFIDINNVYPAWYQFKVYEVVWAVYKYLRRYMPDLKQYIFVEDSPCQDRMFEVNSFKLYWCSAFRGNADKTIMDLMRGFNAPYIWSEDRRLCQYAMRKHRARPLPPTYSVDDEKFNHPSLYKGRGELQSKALLLGRKLTRSQAIVTSMQRRDAFKRDQDQTLDYDKLFKQEFSEVNYSEG